MYSIDHAARNAQYMEDIWEMLNFSSLHLTEDQKRARYDIIRRGLADNPLIDPLPEFDSPEAAVMDLYRNCREAALFMDNYWLTLQAMSAIGIGEPVFREKKSRYETIIRDHIQLAVKITERLAGTEYGALSALTDPLKVCYDISGLKEGDS
jgi:hypothetical protein